MFPNVRNDWLAAAAALALLPLASPRAEPASDPEASAPRFTVPVKGLTAGNADVVLEEMEALGEQLDLVFLDVAPRVEAASLTFSFSAGRAVYFSEVENTIGNADVVVRREALQVPSGARLVLVGATEPEAVAALRKALEKARLFESFTLRVDEDAGDVIVVPVMKAAAPYATLATRIKEKTEYVLTDFAWVTPAPRKS